MIDGLILSINIFLNVMELLKQFTDLKTVIISEHTQQSTEVFLSSINFVLPQLIHKLLLGHNL